MNKRIGKRFLTIILGALIALMLVGCGGEKTLESFYGKPANARQIEEQLKSLKAMYVGVYSDIAIKAEGNTMIYSYTYATELDQSQKSAFYDMMSPSMKAEADKLFTPLKNEAGLPQSTKITISYRFNNPDGSLYCDFTYSE